MAKTTNPEATWFVWDGSSEISLTLEGLWDGTSVQPLTYEGVTS